ncbi:arginine--tRNA ligase [Pontiella sulfatireligans]|uniref:Arginine--tRNA ligase n=1 Tax=Pontiella sulfatireligans TaxID=2750658 RepID=A0A6C2UF05_9BACT|nr:arginine--tRNA ligase [Pontiella sulfatireligans]VGO18463.1 Arginine--tRNA ligase [Pontiella sulfatireligans]
MREFATFEERLSIWTTDAMKSVFGLEGTDINLGVSPTNNDKFGDYQCNAAMSLAKTVGKAPRQIAQEFADAAVLPDFVEKIEIAGPGFINFFLSNHALAAYLQSLENDPHLGAEQVGQGKTVIVDYSSPNVAKPMHIGHIRSTVIGNAIDRLYRYLGYNVIADNHLGDWGTQFGLMMVGFRNFVDEDALKAAPVEELERVYVASYNMSKEDASWREQAKAELVKLQQGDAENRALWEKFIELSIEEFNTIYNRLGVKFDLYRGESFYNDRLPKMIQSLEEKDLAKESDGALIVGLEEDGMPICIVRKSDGGYNYATTDLATVEARIEEFDPERIIYVTDERQQLHFKQFFTISEKLGMNANLVHVWFGLMRLPEATFSTREGNVIKLAALLDEAEVRALEMVKSSSPEMPEEQQRDLAKAIGIGAIKYTDLSQNPQSLVTFTWEKALNMQGNSAPYLQYAYARISSVYDKFHATYPEIELEKCSINIEHEIERRLAIKLSRFPAAIRAAADNYSPNILAEYLYDLAQIYSSFYQNVPFLKAEEGVRESRIRICQTTAAILKQGLGLLGIETRERI